jgi:hypothetical protein
MNKLISLAVGGALAVAGTNAFAVSAPTTSTGGSLTLQLFSTNDTTPFSYSFDTGLTYSTLSTLPTAPGSSQSWSLTNLATDLTGFTGTANLVFDVTAASQTSGSELTKAGIENIATTFDPSVAVTTINANTFNSTINSAVAADTAWITNFGTGTNSFTTSTTALNYANAVYNQQLQSWPSGVNAASGTGNSLPFYEIASAKGSTSVAGTPAVTLAGVFTINLTTDTLTYTVPGGGPPPVPVPAALWLLASGLAGLGVVGRRRKQPA